MRTESYVVQQTIVSDDAHEYDRQMNDVLNNAPGATIIDRMDDGRYCSIVRYTKYVHVPETVEEEYYLKGYKFSCKECKHFHMPEDKRRCEGTCEDGRAVRIDAFACEFFYERLARGEQMFKNPKKLKEIKEGKK